MKRLFQNRESIRTYVRHALWIAALVASAGMISRFTSQAYPLPPEGAVPSYSAPSGRYAQWIDEDVRWIITPQERDAYLRLSDNQERLRFIHEFWQHRNPRPGASTDAFREEHYRRIAYANAHFASSEPGWRTDRGRTYIVDGRPESIDSHPVGNAETDQHPYEVWHYDSVQEQDQREPNASPAHPAAQPKHSEEFRFVDVCNCGEYHLQP